MGVSGDIRINGHPLLPSSARHLTGYVQQVDVLPGTSTVWEFLMHHAELRLPRSFSKEGRSHWGGKGSYRHADNYLCGRLAGLSCTVVSRGL